MSHPSYHDTATAIDNELADYRRRLNEIEARRGEIAASTVLSAYEIHVGLERLKPEEAALRSAITTVEARRIPAWRDAVLSLRDQANTIEQKARTAADRATDALDRIQEALTPGLQLVQHQQAHNPAVGHALEFLDESVDICRNVHNPNSTPWAQADRAKSHFARADSELVAIETGIRVLESFVKVVAKHLPAPASAVG